MGGLELLSVAEMYRADALASSSGIGSLQLMEAAGFAVAHEVRRRFSRYHVVVLCGPGNNGGDGFVAARLLARDGYAVRVALLGDRRNLGGDAARMASLWHGKIESLSLKVLDRADVVIDALFGAGLARPLEGQVRQIIEELAQRQIPMVAVDVPSGVDGDTGAILGVAHQAVVSVTFFRKKPGHLLLPGRDLCGDVVVADIGIPESVLSEVEPSAAENHPGLWRLRFPWPGSYNHKYNRGQLLVMGGPAMTGAARLASHAARRVGAGLVRLVVPAEAAMIYRSGPPGPLVSSLEDYDSLISDGLCSAAVLGPGCGIGPHLRARVLSALRAGVPCVLDADALTSFAGQEKELFRALSSRSVLTPHDGEAARLFGEMSGSRLERARHAASLAGAVVLLKGSDTVIAHPDGRAVLNNNAPAWLATAGSGDVLAGLIGGLMSAGMESFDAACAGCWLHGAMAQECGPGLIAEDLPLALPKILRELLDEATARQMSRM